jgi:hypothetical protein
MARCCAGDASNFSTAICIADLEEGESVPLTELALLYAGLTSTHVTLDLTTAASCIQQMGALPCGFDSANSLLTPLVNICSAALVPQLVMNGTGCLSSFDCPAGTYCGPIESLDENDVPFPPPGGGSCMQLVAIGSDCTDVGYSSDCTYQAGPAQQAFCGPDAGGITTCQPAVSSGSQCPTGESEQCSSLQCLQVNDAGTLECEPGADFTNLYGSENICTL